MGSDRRRGAQFSATRSPWGLGALAATAWSMVSTGLEAVHMFEGIPILFMSREGLVFHARPDSSPVRVKSGNGCRGKTTHRRRFSEN